MIGGVAGLVGVPDGSLTIAAASNSSSSHSAKRAAFLIWKRPSGRMPGMNLKTARLRQLLRDSHFVGCQDIGANSVTADSRCVTPGALFVAVPGTQTDGHDHVASAIAAGCCAVVVSRELPDLSVAQCVVPCPSTAFATISMALHMGRETMPICAGVTGTNGKTTTTWMLRAILDAAEISAGLIGTIENDNGMVSAPATMTTPSADVLAADIRRMVDSNTSHCVLEISSHALVQKRCSALKLSAAAITNVTHDHLDYHRNIEEYRAAKKLIVDLLSHDAPLLLNIGDQGCRSIRDVVEGSVSVVTYGCETSDSDLRVTPVSHTHRSQRLRLHLASGAADVRLRLIGLHNAENALAAAGLAEQLNVSSADIVRGLESLHAVPGRLERIDEGQLFQVIVDYAHTPDALRRALITIRGFVPGRVICVFGAGGNRDQSKRPLMAQAAAAADLCIVTSDNPRNENPNQIVSDIIAGMPSGTAVRAEVDRGVAIQQAIETAEPGDVVLIAGKGHESRQELDGETVPFDDRQVARKTLRERIHCEPYGQRLVFPLTRRTA